MLVFGHRGAAGYAAENTLGSMRRALALQVDGIEFDVRLTRDEVPIVIHDATLERTMGLPGEVSDFSSLELRALLPDHDTTVPTLLEVLKVIGKSTRLNVEFKQRDAVEPTLHWLKECTHVDMIRADQVLLTSFDLAAVEAAARCDQFAIGLLTQGIPEESFWQLADHLNANTVNIDLKSVNAKFVGQARELGLSVMVYTVNTLSEAQRMHAMGVEAIFSDFPDRVRV